MLLIFLSLFCHVPVSSRGQGCPSRKLSRAMRPLRDPIIRVIARRSRARLPLDNYDDNQHAPNENLRLRPFVTRFVPL